MLHLAISDWLVIGIYIVILLAITIRHLKAQDNANDFLLAGRQLTLPIFVGTLVSTWYGGILGISELVGFYGIGTWLVQCAFWYIVYLLFALFIASKIRKLEFYTIPDVLEWCYGKRVAFLGGIFTYLMVNPAPYLLSLALVLHYLFAPVLSLTVAVIIATVLTVVYSGFAGFRGVVYTDFFQFFWMFLAFALLFAGAFWQFGGYGFLEQNLSTGDYAQHLTLTGGMDWGYILVWAGLAFWVLADPNFYQRCFAAKDTQVARKGVLWAIVFWFIFDFFAISTALYAFAAENAQLLDIEDGKLAYFRLAETVLPSPLLGLLVAGILSILMSTTDSFMFVAAVNLSRDYYWRYRKKKPSDQEMVRMTRVAILLTGIFAAALGIYLESVVQLWYIIGTVGLSGLLVPLLHAFFGKTHHPMAAQVAMVSGAFVSCCWLLEGTLGKKEPDYIFGLPPLYSGLLISLVSYYLCHFLITRLLRKSPPAQR